MKHAVFITGFNNWGKTSIITELFDDRQRFYLGWDYRIKGINADFTVETHSNDDYWGQSWVDLIQKRIDHEPKNKPLHLFTALCPTMEHGNNFIDLLSSATFSNYKKKYIFLLEFKWEHHAKLIINNITKSGSGIPNVNFIVINADQNLTDDQARFDAKINQIRRELTRIFP